MPSYISYSLEERMRHEAQKKAKKDYDEAMDEALGRIHRFRIRQNELAALWGINRSSVSKKLNERRLTAQEFMSLNTYLSIRAVY